jgi:hypothetical protein
MAVFHNSGQVQSIVQSTEFISNKNRVKSLMWVKNCVIFHFIPFDFCTHSRIRSTLDIMSDGERLMPYESLHPKAIRHMIVEIYTALKNVIVNILETNTKDMPIANIHFTVDKVKSKVSSDNYLGLRVFLLDSKGVYRSINLSIKEFIPSSSLFDVSASEVLKTWLTYSFSEFNLDIKKHIGTKRSSLLIFSANS